MPRDPPAPVESVATRERAWQQALTTELRMRKRYPLVARRLSQEGVVVVVARVHSDGTLDSLEIKHGSGYPLLDRDALSLFESASEAVRGQLHPGQATEVVVPIAYRLEG
jgi:periplasmic protein TonB